MKTVTGRARFWLFGWVGLALMLSAGPISAQSTDPIKIGVIGEESSVAGASLTKAAVMAADDINAHGGVSGRKIEVITYDNHSSASDSVRAFQRAASQDKVVAPSSARRARTRWSRLSAATSARWCWRSSLGRHDYACRSSRRVPPAI
jgi:hypothetical protein